MNVVIFFDSKCKAEIAQTFQVNLEGAVALHEEWAPVNSDRAQGDKILLCTNKGGSRRPEKSRKWESL